MKCDMLEIKLKLIRNTTLSEQFQYPITKTAETEAELISLSHARPFTFLAWCKYFNKMWRS